MKTCDHSVLYVLDFANQCIPLRPDGCLLCERDEIVSKRDEAMTDLGLLQDDYKNLLADNERYRMDAEKRAAFVTALDNERKELSSKLGSLQEDYEAAAHHADRGWDYLKDAVAALCKIAFNHAPEPAKLAYEALRDLPSAGAYEGMLPEPPK